MSPLVSIGIAVSGLITALIAVLYNVLTNRIKELHENDEFLRKLIDKEKDARATEVKELTKETSEVKGMLQSIGSKLDMLCAQQYNGKWIKIKKEIEK